MTPTRKTCPPDHKHGRTANCYKKHACRCTPCGIAESVRMAGYRADRAAGRTRLVDPRPARAHLVKLRDVGLGTKRIAELAGVSTTVVGYLRYGNPSGPVPFEQLRIRVDIADKILAVPVDATLALPFALVPGRSTRRRLQGFIALGWSGQRLAGQLGMSQDSFSRMLIGDHRVTARTAAAVSDLYERLCFVLPPESTPGERSAATRARNLAQRRGWVVPLAWDDIDNDARPAAAPRGPASVDDIAIDLVVSGTPVKLTAAERKEAIRRLNARELSDTEIANLVGINPRNVLRTRDLLGIPAAGAAA